MKTKLTFLTLALVALLGVGMLMAFKQNVSKKYITIFRYNVKSWYLVNEENALIELNEYSSKDPGVVMNKVLNEYSSKGYKLTNISWAGSSTTDQVYIVFEKE